MSTAERPASAVTLLRWQVWLVFLVPAGLRFAPLGALGRPALVHAGLLLLVWSAWVVVPSLRVGGCAPVRWALLALGAVALVSFGVLHRGGVVADEANGADRFVVAYACLAAVALVAAEGLPDRAAVEDVLRTFVAAAATMAAVGLLQYRGVWDAVDLVRRIPGLSEYRPLTPILSRAGLARPAGTATHPIEFGVVLAVALAFAVHFVAHDLTRPMWRRTVPLALIALAIPVSVSRSALLVSAVVLVTVVVGSDARTQARAAQAVFVLAAAVFVLAPGLLGTLWKSMLIGRADPSISTRTRDYDAVAPQVAASPWWGRGPGTFLPRFRILDNQYLLTLVELGVAGVAALVVLFGAVGVLGASVRRWSPDPGERHLGLAFMAAGFGVLAAAATFDALSFPLFTTVFMLVLGLAGASWGLARRAVGVPS